MQGQNIKENEAIVIRVGDLEISGDVPQRVSIDGSICAR